MTDPAGYLTCRAADRYLHATSGTVSALVETGKIPGFRPEWTRWTVVRIRDLDRYMDERRAPAPLADRRSA